MKKIILFIIVLLCITPIFADLISSKTSQIFHKKSCRYATNLNETNSFIYNNYQDAIDAGLRACKVCNPKPEPKPEPEPDPNDINLFPKQPSIVIPINGVVLQMDYCWYEYNPETVGKPIIVKEEFEITLKEAMDSELGMCLYYSGDPNIYTNPEEDDPNSYNNIVYTTYLSKFYHKKDCNHFKGVELTMINRETSIKAGNNATWYPESGIVTWRITPFDIGDYVAIGNSDLEQTELLAVSARPFRVPNLQDFTDSWLKGNFDMKKYGEWVDINGKISSTNSNYNREISWIYKNGRWTPHGGTRDRILVQKEHEIINEITTRDRTTTTYERPLPYSAIWEMTKKEIKEITTIQYIREEDDPTIFNRLGTTDRLEWIFINGTWVVVNSQINPYINESVYPSGEDILKTKPVEPTYPDPNAVDEEEQRLKFLMIDPQAAILRPFLEKILLEYSPEKTYEEKLIQYGADYAEYKKNLKIWEETTSRMEEERHEMEEEEHEMEVEESMMIDREYRRIEEIKYMEEEQKISVIEELLIDEKITDEQKGTLREILNAIREN